MKIKLLSVLIAFILLLQGCGSKSEANKTKAVAETNTYAMHLTRSEFISKVIDITNSPENAKYLGDKPCIVDFYASWCGPCKVVAPILEELAKEYEGRIYIYKVNTENEKQLSTEIGIQSIPLFLFFPMEGKPFSSMGIAKTPEETKKMFKEIIDKQLLTLGK